MFYGACMSPQFAVPRRAKKVDLASHGSSRLMLLEAGDMRQPYRRLGKSEYRSGVRISEDVVNPPMTWHHDKHLAQGDPLDSKAQGMPKRHHGRIGVPQTPKQAKKCSLVSTRSIAPPSPVSFLLKFTANLLI